jgi:plasmid maintenance system antidote protein VapI
MGVPCMRIERVDSGLIRIADTALHLRKVRCTSAELWLNLQSHYNLKMT